MYESGIKDLLIVIFTGSTGCGKIHFVLDLIGKKYNNHFDHINIVHPMLHWKKTYLNKGWIEHDGNAWLIKPKDKLYQWIEKLLLLLAGSETLFILDNITGDESLDNWEHFLFELAISGR